MTDHQPLTRLMEQPVLTRVQTRWIRLGLFQSINPTIQYQPGKANIVADALSRSQRAKDPRSSVQRQSHEAAETEAQIEDENHVFTVTASTVHIQPSEIQRWTQAYTDDAKLRAAIEELRQGKRQHDYELSPDGLLTRRTGDQTKIVVPAQLKQQVLRECHDIPAVGHVGIRRTMELVDRHFHWRGMRKDVASYVQTCPTCQMMKSENRAKAGLLQPLEVPARKWEQVTTDLVTDLPESGGYTAIAVFVDRLTKMAHFAPCTKEVTGPEYAKLFVDHVFRLHGLPEVIISDRDPRFTSSFWRELFKLLGTDLRMSTAFHPQTDGQSERMIQTLENFLRPYVERNPTGWSQQLAMAEFAANNAVHVATGHSAFFLNS